MQVLQIRAAGVPRMIHIGNASMNDVLSDVSSTRTTVFSKQTSITTKSSYSSLSVKSGRCSRLIDALDLGIQERKDRCGGSVSDYVTRTFSMSNAGIVRKDTFAIEEDGGTAQSTRDNAGLETTSAPCLHRNSSETGNTRQYHTNESIPSMSGGLSSPYSTENVEAFPETHEDVQVSPKWFDKLGRATNNIEVKARRLAKATKKLGLTLRAFLR